LLKKIAERQSLRRVTTFGSFIVLLIFLPVSWSFYRYYTYHEKENPRKILIIQPNIDPYSEKFDEGAVNEKLSKFVRLAEGNLTTDIDYIVGPETVFEENWNEKHLADYPAFRQLQMLIKAGTGTSLVIGASTYRIYDDQGKAPSTARHSREGTVFDVYNTALFTDPSGNYQSYHKSILVPGVEKMPLRGCLKFLDRLIINLGGTSGSLGIQPEPTNFIAPNGDRIAPAICYESVFGGYIAEFIRKGAGMIFIITNDGWWKKTPGYRQHFSFARLRAVETRRSIVRSANTGISGFINQRGDVLQHSRWWVESALTGKVNVNNHLTFYVKHGDYLAGISILVSAFLLLNGLVLRFIRGKKNPHQF
jgi:apolipoprotein N-acyltransferase